MPDPSLDRLRDIVCEAARRPPDERRATAERLCDGDETLLAAALDLLQLDADRIQRVDALAEGAVDGWVEEWHASGDGAVTEIERYTLHEELGRGGSSIVYRATQTEPVRREVALKVLRGRRRDAASRDRFLAEQQVLAMLEHPNVARVFEAGTTDDDAPWFAMELVRGPDLVAACRDDDLPLRERIDLVVQACWGVEHAHRKGILHRDIKPSNLLVAGTHPQRTVKVIDFGISRPLEESAAPQLTLAGHMIGTPQYMSPEQARDDRARIDVRSDVFALGVVLHEAVTGALPYEVDTTSTLAVLGAVARGETRILDGDRRLPEDLRAILRRAMHEDPELRYATPADLARDLQRYLDGRPVEARPAGVVYTTRKFVGRHPFGATATALFVLTLIGATITSTVLYRQATRATERAETKAETVGTLSQYLQDMFRAAGPTTGDRQVTLPEVLDDAIERARTQLDTEPLVKAEVLAALGGLEADLGDLPDAHDIFVEAVALLEGAPRKTDEAQRLALELYVSIVGLSSEFEPFPDVLREAHTILDRIAVADVPDDVRAAHEYQIGFRMAFACAMAEAPHEAGRFLELADGALDRMPGDTEVQRIQLGYMEAQNLAAADRHAEAIAVYRRTLEGYEKHLGREDARALTVRSAMAISQRELGELDAAVANHRMNVEFSRNDLGPDHPKMATKHGELAHSLLRTGEADEAATHVARAAAIWATVPDMPSETRLAELRGGLALVNARADEATEHFTSALAILDAGGEQRIVQKRRLLTERALAWCLAGRPESAAKDVDAAFSLADSAGSIPPPRLRILAAYADLHRGRVAAARDHLDAALASLGSADIGEDPLESLIRSVRARIDAPGDREEAARWTATLDASKAYPALRRIERLAWAALADAGRPGADLADPTSH